MDIILSSFLVKLAKYGYIILIIWVNLPLHGSGISNQISFYGTPDMELPRTVVIVTVYTNTLLFLKADIAFLIESVLFDIPYYLSHAKQLDAINITHYLKSIFQVSS